jgi:hypothetical protein
VQPVTVWRVPVGSAVLQDLDGETVGLNMLTSAYFSLNTTASTVFQLLLVGADVEALVTAILDVYDVDRATAERDVGAFLDELRQQDLLEMV